MSTLENWAIGGLIVAVLGIFGVQEIRIANEKLEVASLHKLAAEQRADIERLGREHAQRLGEIQAVHAAQQQGIEDAYQKKLAALAARHAADGVDLERLRRDTADYATPSDAGDQVDAAACRRARDRLATLGGLFAESASLLVESLGRVEARDAEVKLLVDQLNADRAAVAAASSASETTPATGGPGHPID